MEKKTILKFHILFWGLISGISFLHVLVYQGNLSVQPIIISITARITLNAVTFYIYYFFIAEIYLKKHNKVLIVLSCTLFTVIYSFAYTVIYITPYAFVLSPENPAAYIFNKGLKNNIYLSLAYTVTFSILGSTAKISLIWYKNQLKKKEIEKQNISNELAMLKAQVNPHFLFNTMNNIKSLIKSRPNEAVQSADKLNGIMQYMIFGSSQELVPFKDEIEHIKNYLELERIRFSEPDFIKFEIIGEYSGIMVPPLLFMPFIENAFKHGSRKGPAPGIIIKFAVTDSEIKFEAINHKKDNDFSNSSRSGFGLPNIRRRLELLTGNKHELNITNNKDLFSVNLKLILT